MEGHWRITLEKVSGACAKFSHLLMLTRRNLVRSWMESNTEDGASPRTPHYYVPLIQILHFSCDTTNCELGQLRCN